MSLDAMIEMNERAAIPCVWCEEVGEPHACQRAFWQQRLAHVEGRQCSDEDCLCHVAALLQAEVDRVRRYLRGRSS